MAKKMAIPWELKYKFAMGGWTSLLKGFLYAIREKFDAATALEIYDRVLKMDDRVKKLTNTILNVFKLEGNDAETITMWWGLWGELTGREASILERSPTIYRRKVTKCPWLTEPEDLSDRCLSFCNIVDKTINPKAIVERPKAMCAGDPHCVFVTNIVDQE